MASAALRDALHAPVSPAALALIKDVCHLITRRAARLSAAGVVAVLEHMGAAKPPSAYSAAQPPPTVAVDGGACRLCAALLSAELTKGCCIHRPV